MQRRDVKKGLATLCIGGGMGTALVARTVLINHKKACNERVLWLKDPFS